MYLRQSTSVAISFGPFVAFDDGVTIESSMVSFIDHGTTGIKLSKNGGALTIRAATVTASTYDSYGNYIVTLSATDTNTIGRLRVQFNDGSAVVPVWQDFTVLDEAVYDWMFGVKAPLTPVTAGRELVVDAAGLADANMVKVGPTGSGTAQTAGDIIGDTNDIQSRLPASLSGGLMQASIQATGNAVIGGFSFENDAFDGLYFGTTGNNAIVAAFGTGSSLTALGTAAELAKVPKSDSNVTWNATAAAQIQTEANDALVANNLDHLMLSAVDTDFATTVHLNSVIGHLADNGTSATFDRATDSMEAQRDNVGTAGAGLTAADDATLSAIAALNNLSSAQAQTAAAAALTAYDPPTHTELTAAFTEIKGATWASTDSLEAIRDRGDAAWLTATGFSTHSAADVWGVATRVLTAGTNIQLPSNGLANVTAWSVAITGNITGNLSGSVGSVTGAVGSVTGAVGSVTGMTASDVGAIKAKTDNLPSDPADASDIASAFGTVNSTLATIATYVDTEVAAIKAKTDLIPAAPAAVGDVPTAAQNAATILATGDVDGFTVEETLKLCLAILAGKLSGAATTTVAIRAADDSKARVTATVDASGNRSAVTLDAAG